MQSILAKLSRVGTVILLTFLTLSFASAANAKALKVAAIFGSGIENAWSKAWIDSFERVKTSSKDGLELSLKYTENVGMDSAMNTIRGYAETGEYDIIWIHNTASDEVEALKDEFPNILFVVAGGGNRALGGNAYYMDMHIYEPAYVAGVFAAHMSKSKVLGVVGLFPTDNVNDVVHAFREGAVAADPSTKVKVSFIESWYDPAKASEAANAQIAAGADIIFQLGESYQVCEERKILCIGEYVDGSQISPTSVPLSVLVNWEPQIRYVISEWEKHKSTGKPYDAPMKSVWFSMADGGGNVSGYGPFEDKVPEAVKQAVAKAIEDIRSGAIKVKFDVSQPTSD